MRRMTAARRGGFTLLELLTVLAILAALAALATAAFFRARKSQEQRATEATVSKLRGMLDGQWKAVMDSIRDDLKNPAGRIGPGYDTLLAFAGGDKDRAGVLYAYCKLKNEFPTTIQEACNPVSIPVWDSGTSTFVAQQLLQPKAVFTEGFRKQITPKQNSPVSGLVGTQVATRRAESAACLYWALSNTAARGQASGAETAGQQATDLAVDVPVQFTTGGSTVTGTISGVRVFVDSWGDPICFQRQGYSGELDTPEYNRTTTAKSKDPLDPLGKLSGAGAASWVYQGQNSTALLTEFWKKLFLTPHATLEDKDGINPFGPSPAPVSGTQGATPLFATYPGSRNWVPTLISAGGDKQFDPNLGQGDDILSYRLAREGNKGN